MEKKNIDWASLGFGYMETDYSFVSYYKDGKWADAADADMHQHGQVIYIYIALH